MGTKAATRIKFGAALAGLAAGCTLFALFVAQRVCSQPGETIVIQPPDLLPPEEIAERVAQRFGVEPDEVRVGELAASPSVHYAHIRPVWLDKHDPPLRLAVEATTGRVYSVDYLWPESPEEPSGQPVLELDEAKEMALETARLCFDGVPEDYEVRFAHFVDAAHRLYWFHWQRSQNGVRLPDRLAVGIDAVNARPRFADHFVYPVTVPLEATVSREEAIATAGEAVKHLLREGEVLGAPKEVVLEVGFGTSDKRQEQQFRWRVRVMVGEPEAREVGDVCVDARSGEVLGIFPVQVFPVQP